MKYTYFSLYDWNKKHIHQKNLQNFLIIIYIIKFQKTGIFYFLHAISLIFCLVKNITTFQGATVAQVVEGWTSERESPGLIPT